MQQSVSLSAEVRQGVSEEVCKEPVWLSSSFSGFLYAAAYMFATMFTCPVDHYCDIYRKNSPFLHRPLPSKQFRLTSVKYYFLNFNSDTVVLSTVTQQDN